MKVAVTGSNGFVGKRLCQSLLAQNYGVLPVVRKARGSNELGIGEIGPHTKWAGILGDVDCIVHLAARVHIMNDSSVDPLADFRKINVDGTVNLARHAVDAGVKRFIYLSSIKVNGEKTVEGKPFRETDSVMPEDAYAISKLEAENCLQKISEETGMEVVVIRPPLVYGAGVKANFAKMLCWLNKGYPLPFGAIHNKRSLVALDNLVSLIIFCIEHPAAANQIFLAGDDEDMSTTELLQRAAQALGRKQILLPVPGAVLKLGFRALGKIELAQRLCDSLQVDISKAKTLLGWKPPVTVEQALKYTADAFLQSLRR